MLASIRARTYTVSGSKQSSSRKPTRRALPYAAASPKREMEFFAFKVGTAWVWDCSVGCSLVLGGVGSFLRCSECPCLLDRTFFNVQPGAPF